MKRITMRFFEVYIILIITIVSLEVFVPSRDDPSNVLAIAAASLSLVYIVILVFAPQIDRYLDQ